MDVAIIVKYAITIIPINIWINVMWPAIIQDIYVLIKTEGNLMEKCNKNIFQCFLCDDCLKEIEEMI
jgi:hypothetical protein